MGKLLQPSQPGVYRDEPDRDDAASTSSAVLMGDVDYPEDELPAYTDEPQIALPSTQLASELTNPLTYFYWYHPPTALPFSTHDLDSSEIRTRFPDYSTNAKTLLDMVKEQAKYPPTYFVELNGTHTETTRNGNKTEKSNVTDFLIRINITHLLTPSIGRGGRIELLPDNKRGYRGTRLPSLRPTVGISDTENLLEELSSWCEAFVHNPASVKSFTLRREIINHDTKKLEQLLRSAIAETNYRGHLSVSFPTSHKRVVVYSPGVINEWRITTWIRWVFYLTFLWIFTWPVLFFLTHKYEVVKVVYPYANVPVNDGGNRECVVQSEVDWYYRWRSAIKKSVLARTICKDNPLSEEYRIATVKADAQGPVQSLIPNGALRTGDAVADGAFGFLHEGLRVAENWNVNRGWGADS